MNLDEKRLSEIQREKRLYTGLLDKAETISDCLQYQEQLQQLSNEEKEILERCKVKI